MENKQTGDESPELFGAGISVGEEIAREQLAGQLAEQGFNIEDINEALYSGDTDVYRPRKGRGRGKVNRSAKQRATMPQIRKGGAARRVHDPAPKRHHRRAGRRYDNPIVTRYVTRTKEVARRGGRKAKGILGKLRKYALPGSAGITFLAAYSQRATEMEADPVTFKNADGTPVKGMLQAIMWDVKNFKSADAMERVKTNAAGIITPAVIGYGVKEFKVAGKYSGLAGDLLMGFAAGTAAKVILDPPVPQRGNVGQANAAQAAAMQAAAMQAQRYQAPPERRIEQSYTNKALPLYSPEGGF